MDHTRFDRKITAFVRGLVITVYICVLNRSGRYVYNRIDFEIFQFVAFNGEKDGIKQGDK